ncbi:unnamed protein product, partial [Laminaria digitata]
LSVAAGGAICVCFVCVIMVTSNQVVCLQWRTYICISCVLSLVRETSKLSSALVCCFGADTAWQIVTLNGKYNNPSTNFSVSNEVYEFPSLDICVWGGKGCDEDLSSADCIGTAGFTVYDPCFIKTEGLETTSKGSNCVAFDLASLDME